MSRKICLSTLAIYFAVMCAFVVMRICSYCGVFSFLGEWKSLVFSLVTQILLIGLVPALLFKKANGAKRKDMKSFFNLRKTSFKVVLLAVLLGAVVFVVNAYVSTFFNTIIELFGYTPSTSSTETMTWGMFFLELFTTAVLPAICEELLHRGMLLSGTAQLGFKKSILISGIFFGLLHLNIEQFFYATLIGVFLAYLCYGCNSIYPCMIVHFMNNAISVTLSFMSSNGIKAFSGVSGFVLNHKVMGVVLLVVLLGLLVFLGYKIVMLMFKESFKFNFQAKQKEISARAIRKNFFDDVEKIKVGQEESEQMYQTQRRVVMIDLEHFMDFVSKNLSEVQPDGECVKKIDEKSRKTELKLKILLWGTVALGTIITIMTFIWGLFR